MTTKPHNLPLFLKKPELRLIFFGGKGGVGKTTMACATALYLAELHQHQKKTLIVSTDPAHSLSDIFGIQIGDQATPVKEASGMALYARELDAARLLARFKAKNGDVLKELMERGTYFDREDIQDFLDLSIPGMDEVMAVMEISRLLGQQKFHRIIVDTAPTGHTLRMLKLPNQMKEWTNVLDLMQHKHRFLFTQFSGKKYVKDRCDRFLDELSRDIQRIEKVLSNRDTTRFVPVLIPEMMIVLETGRLLDALQQYRVPVDEVIINRVAEIRDCPFCMKRAQDQKAALKAIEVLTSPLGNITVPLFPRDTIGIPALKTTADYISGLPEAKTDLRIETREVSPSSCIKFAAATDLIIFGGKGGVGKTTMASATALHMAQVHPDKKILLFSSDPAHSLSDIFDTHIGNDITPIMGSVHGGRDRGVRSGMPETQLYGLEVNPETLWTDFKAVFKEDIKHLFDQFLGNKADIRFDRQVMTEMLEMAPPGLDEIMALDRMMELERKNAFDIYVLDTSPTGHLIRFLELPQLVREWLQAFFRLLMKYRGVVRLTKAAEKALNLSKNVRKIQGSLKDEKKTRFVGVTTTERMGLLELDRLIKAIEKNHIPCEHIICNMLMPETDCGFCAHKRAEEQTVLHEIHRRFETRHIIAVPLFPYAVCGATHLARIDNHIFCGNGT